MMLRIVVLLVFLSNSLLAQDSPLPETDFLGKRVTIILNNGREQSGVVKRDDGREIGLQTDWGGTAYFEKVEIDKIVLIQEEASEEKRQRSDFRSSSAFSNRYYLSPNAFPVRRGEGYGNIHLFGPEAHFSLTENLSIGLVTSWLAGPGILSIKYAVPLQTKGIHFAVGAMVGNSVFLDEIRQSGGYYYGMLTLGSRAKNFTISGGFFRMRRGKVLMYEEGVYATREEIPRIWMRGRLSQGPVLGIGGCAPVGKYASLLVDGMLSRYRNEWVYQYPSSPFNEGDPYIVNASFWEEERMLIVFMPSIRIQKRHDRAFQVGIPLLFEWRPERNEIPFPQLAASFSYFFLY
jgi:hypothetical protein